MGRRSGIEGLVRAIAREAARQSRLGAAEQRRQLREQERRARQEQREALRLANEEARHFARSQREEARAAKLRYLESRQSEADEATSEVFQTVEALKQF